MKKDLDRDDLIALVRGTSPNYSIMDDDLIRFCGAMAGAPNENWQWGSLRRMSDEKLWDIYCMCKQSWK